MSILFRDIHHGLRTLLRQPLFTLVAVCTLGLGIGANTAVFSVFDAVLLRPLSYPHSEQLIMVRSRTPKFPRASISYPDYLDWRAGQHSLTDLAIMRRGSFNLSAGQDAAKPPEHVEGMRVSANYLSVTGLTPVLGRNFTEEEDTPGGPRAVVLTDALWRRRFGADPAVVGRRLTLDSIPREIVGILPPTERFLTGAEVYVPLGELRAEPGVLERGNQSFSAIGRLKPGMTPALANQDLDTISRELQRRYPKTNTNRLTNVQYLLEYTVGKYRHGFLILLVAVGCVLLIACANVANLQLARTTTREKELAVRAALGASRWRLARQLLTESALLGALGGLLGVLLALWAVAAIVASSPADDMRFRETHLDVRALSFTAIIALGAGLLAGLWPAWRISSMAAMAAALREGGGRSGTGSASQHRTRSLLVVLQVALAVVLLTGAGMTLKSFWRMQNEPVGFNPQGILLASISLPMARYDTGEKQAQFYKTLVEHAAALPGAESVAIGMNLPFDDTEWDSSFHITGQPPDQPGQEPSAEMTFATSDYFKVMGMPLLRGRPFGPQDTKGQQEVGIIDESFAHRFFPDKDPIGQQIELDRGSDLPLQVATIVGVVQRTRNNPPSEDPSFDSLPQLHLPMAQSPTSNATLLVRVASGDPLRLAEPLRRLVLSIDDELPVSDLSTMEGNIVAKLASQHLLMALLGVFAGIALLLASIGLYGVMALTVTQRTRELGIRLALGAQRRAVLGLIMRQGVVLVGIGLAVGLVAAMALGRFLAGVLYGVVTSDLLALLTAVTVALTGASLLACWLPARRATRVDPMHALRSE